MVCFGIPFSKTKTLAMKAPQLLFLALLFPCLPVARETATTGWVTEKHKGYVLNYQQSDRQYKKEYRKLIETGMQTVRQFFGDSYPQTFTVCIHPDRQSLDSRWQKDWNMPEFKSECWMVASGIATRLDVISPARWDSLACEHRYADQGKTRQLIAHELVHVYHGQRNVSPDFSDVTGIDWFVEGLATYASGQCDDSRLVEVKNALAAHKIPASLDEFWTGKLKYGLSGSMVQYIDHTYGRKKLNELLRLNNKTALLTALNITEAGLLAGWAQYLSGQQ